MGNEPVEESDSVDSITLVKDFKGAISTFQTHGDVLIELDNDRKLLEIAHEKKEKANKKTTPKAEKRWRSV